MLLTGTAGYSKVLVDFGSDWWPDPDKYLLCDKPVSLHRHATVETGNPYRYHCERLGTVQLANVTDLNTIPCGFHALRDVHNRNAVTRIDF